MQGIVGSLGLLAVAYLGGLTPSPGAPFQPTIIFYDGIFGCFTKFFSSKTSKFRHSVTNMRQLLGTSSPDPTTGALPLDPTGRLPSPDPLGTLLSHIVNTPLASRLFVQPCLTTACKIPTQLQSMCIENELQLPMSKLRTFIFLYMQLQPCPYKMHTRNSMLIVSKCELAKITRGQKKGVSIGL